MAKPDVLIKHSALFVRRMKRSRPALSPAWKREEGVSDTNGGLNNDGRMAAAMTTLVFWRGGGGGGGRGGLSALPAAISNRIAMPSKKMRASSLGTTKAIY